MHLFDSFDHALSDEAAGLEIELSLTCHEKILETWSEHVHNHYMKLIFLVGFVGSDVVELRDVRLASKLMNQFTLPKQHHVLLVLDSSFDFSRIGRPVFLLFHFINFSESAVT